MAKIDLSNVNFKVLKEAMDKDAKNRPSWNPPTILPPAWEVLEILADGARYKSKSRNLRAILTCSFEEDGKAWLHLSVSHRTRIPDWKEFVWCKDIFLGNREAYQVFPPEERYVNINSNVLHLFAPLDNTAVLPDFTHGSRSL